MTALSSDDRPSDVVIAEVARATDQSPLQMKPLAEVIDPDALDGLFGTSNRNTSSGSVTFEYCGISVTVSATEVQLGEV